jgi:hypothetical protein
MPLENVLARDRALLLDVSDGVRRGISQNDVLMERRRREDRIFDEERVRGGIVLQIVESKLPVPVPVPVPNDSAPPLGKRIAARLRWLGRASELPVEV